MLAGLGTYLVVFFALLVTAIIILTMSVVYRIREQGIRALALGGLGLAFMHAFLFQNTVTERLLAGYVTEGGQLPSLPYVIVKQLDASIINGFKGPLIDETVAPGYWLDRAILTLVIAFFVLVAAVAASYLALEMLGLSRTLVLAGTGLIAVIALAGIFMTSQSISLYEAGSINEALATRDTAATLKLVPLVLGFLLMAVGSFMVYRETGSKVYLVYTAGQLVLVLGLIIFATTWYSSWENYVKELAAQGNLAPALGRFYASGLLLVVGSLLLLIGSIVEAVPPVEEEEFEELEELEEAEGELPEEVEEAEIEEAEAGEATEEAGGEEERG